MHVHKLLLTCLAALGGVSCYVAVPRARGITPFTNATIFQAPGNHSVSYARTETLPGNALLATWADFGTSGETLIYRSKDDGETWHAWGRCESDVSGRTLVQPHLLYLDEPFGDEDAGVLLLAVNAVDDSSTNIEVYGSYDEGRSFEFISRVAEGGRANTTNGATPVWEPFLLRHNDRLVVYYSDQRDPKHGQKLVQQTTTGGLDNWGPVVDVVASDKYTDRPGMLVVTKLPNGEYFMVFEYARLEKINATSEDYKYPIYYKLSYDPENANDAAWNQLVVDVGTRSNGGPFATWSPMGGENGTILVSDSDHSQVWTNRALGRGVFQQIQTPHGRAYSRELRIPANDNTKLRITGGAEYDADPPTKVETTVMDLQLALAQLERGGERL